MKVNKLGTPISFFTQIMVTLLIYFIMPVCLYTIHISTHIYTHIYACLCMYIWFWIQLKIFLEKCPFHIWHASAQSDEEYRYETKNSSLSNDIITAECWRIHRHIYWSAASLLLTCQSLNMAGKPCCYGTHFLPKQMITQNNIWVFLVLPMFIYSWIIYYIFYLIPLESKEIEVIVKERDTGSNDPNIWELSGWAISNFCFPIVIWR